MGGDWAGKKLEKFQDDNIDLQQMTFETDHKLETQQESPEKMTESENSILLPVKN